MVKYIKQKQQQEQQLQSLLPPELDTLTLHEGGVPIIKGGGTFIKGTRVLNDALKMSNHVMQIFYRRSLCHSITHLVNQTFEDA